MYIHLGQKKVVSFDEIVGIFDLDTTTVSKISRDFLNKAEKNKKVINVSQDIPKSFVICSDSKDEKIYLSQISGTSLIKKKSQKGKSVNE